MSLINNYEDFVDEHRRYPMGLTYATLALAGEAGEVANTHKKELRDKVNKRDDLILELGDVLWYVTACAHELGVTLNDIMIANIEKLMDRHNDNTSSIRASPCSW